MHGARGAVRRCRAKHILRRTYVRQTAVRQQERRRRRRRGRGAAKRMRHFRVNNAPSIPVQRCQHTHNTRLRARSKTERCADVKRGGRDANCCVRRPTTEQRRWRVSSGRRARWLAGCCLFGAASESSTESERSAAVSRLRRRTSRARVPTDAGGRQSFPSQRLRARQCATVSPMKTTLIRSEDKDCHRRIRRPIFSIIKFTDAAAPLRFRSAAANGGAIRRASEWRCEARQKSETDGLNAAAAPTGLSYSCRLHPSPSTFTAAPVCAHRTNALHKIGAPTKPDVNEPREPTKTLT